MDDSSSTFTISDNQQPFAQANEPITVNCKLPTGGNLKREIYTVMFKIVLWKFFSRTLAEFSFSRTAFGNLSRSAMRFSRQFGLFSRLFILLADWIRKLGNIFSSQQIIRDFVNSSSLTNSEE